MRLFNTLSLETTARCNRKCEFCPVAYNTRPDETMDPVLVLKAFHELGGMDYRGRIEFYIYNEPLKEFDSMLATLNSARYLVPSACLMIATNGDYLHPDVTFVEKIQRLFAAGLNQLLINCYSDGLYQRRAKLLTKLPQSIKRDGNVYAVASPRSMMVQMLDKSHADIFGTGIFRLVNRAGNIPQFLPAAAKPVERMCVKPFRIFNINWQGEALMCCQDYHGQLKVGNLRDHTLVELWNSPVMNTYRRHLLKKQRDLPLCRSCDCHAGAYPYNVERPAANAKTLSNAEVEKLFKEKP